MRRMSEKITRANVEAAFQRFCMNGGFKVANAFNDVGGLFLDYNPVYGGFVIEKVSNEAGGVFRPFGDQRGVESIATFSVSRFRFDPSVWTV